jgi:hypothetical protein
MKIFILGLLLMIEVVKASDLGVLYNDTNNNTLSPSQLRIVTFQITTNLNLLYVTPSRALSIDANTNVVSSTLTDTQQGYLAALTGGTNLINLGSARILSGSGNPTNGVMLFTNRTLYINTSSATVNDGLWLNQSTNWFRVASTNGGAINESQLNFSDVTTANSSTNQHGLLIKLSGNTTQFLRGDGGWALPSNNLSNSLAGVKFIGTFDPDPSQQGYTFYNTNHYYTSANGGTLGVPNIALKTNGEIIGDSTTDIVIGSGAVIGSWDVSGYTDTTIGDVTVGHHGLTPKAPNDSSKFLNGLGAWSTPSGGAGGGIAVTGSPVAGEVTYWSGTNSVTGSSGLTFDGTNLVATTINSTTITGTTINLSGGGNLSNGSYTPTLTARSGNVNLVGVVQPACLWTRNGNQVTVTGVIQFNTTVLAGAFLFDVTLPVATTSTTPLTILTGVGSTARPGAIDLGITGLTYICGNGATGAHFVTTVIGATASGLRNCGFTFTYLIQ